jgi:uncharacterized protein DUF1877
MGVNADLIRYPAEVYSQVKSQGTFFPPNDKDIDHCYLDRSWDELHPLLKQMGAPLNRALDGDYGYPGGLDDFGWNEARTSDHYLAFVSPQLVKDIAITFAKLPPEQVAGRLSQAIRGEDYLRTRFDALAAFYQAAAQAGDCVFVCVA